MKGWLLLGFAAALAGCGSGDPRLMVRGAEQGPDVEVTVRALEPEQGLPPLDPLIEEGAMSAPQTTPPTTLSPPARSQRIAPTPRPQQRGTEPVAEAAASPVPERDHARRPQPTSESQRRAEPTKPAKKPAEKKPAEKKEKSFDDLSPEERRRIVEGG
jgi:hypothetical protein